MFDTAEVYGFGRSERILGAALRASGGTDDVVVATKVFPVVPTAAVVQQRGVASAQRLGVQTIDLYQVHQPNPVVRDGTTMRGMRALRDVGIVDEVGVSNYPLRRWQRSEVELGGRVLTNQVQFSLVSRGADGGDAAVGAADRARRDRLQPAGPGPAVGRATTPSTAPTDGVRAANAMFLPENLRRAGPLLSAAARGAPAAHDVDRRRRSRWPWTGAPPARRRDPRRVERGAGGEQRARRRTSRWRADEYGALTAAAEAFHPTTGVSDPGAVRVATELLTWRSGRQPASFVGSGGSAQEQVRAQERPACAVQAMSPCSVS